MMASPGALRLLPMFLVLVPMLAGCSVVDDFGQYSFCVESIVDVDDAVMFDTASSTDEFEGSCGGSDGPDVAYRFQAARDDYYRFSTAGSDFDTVLYLLDGCEGPELACNNNAGGMPTSEVVHRIAEDGVVVAVVDGNADEGDAVLSVEHVTCPEVNLDQASLPLSHTLVGESDDLSSLCGGVGQGDRAYRFTAPEDGFYTFDVLTEATAFIASLSVEDGPVCGGELLQCNSGGNRRSQVSRQMTAEQVVTVIVDGDGSEGAYELDVRRAEAFTTCVDASPGIRTLYMTTLPEDGPHRMSTSCGDTGIWRLGDTDPALIHDFPDLILGFQNDPEPTPGCSASCLITIHAQFPFFASITDGDACQGAEETCMAHETSDSVPSPDEFELILNVPEIDGRQKVLIIDRAIPDDDGGPPFPYDHGDEVTVEMGCIGIC